MINNDQSTLLLCCCEDVKSHRSGGDTVPLTNRFHFCLFTGNRSQIASWHSIMSVQSSL